MVCNFAVPATKLLLDRAQVVMNTFLTREILEDKFLRIENISDVWVGTGQMIIQPKLYRDGDTPVTDFEDYGDRYVDMRKESTLFHSLLLFLLACREILIVLVLVLPIILSWFFLILSPFMAELPIFKFIRSVFLSWWCLSPPLAVYGAGDPPVYLYYLGCKCDLTVSHGCGMTYTPGGGCLLDNIPT
jgi:hypothetical protein